jgi:hypothetical protein
MFICGDEDPGQSDMLELAHEAEVVINRQALLTRPSQSFGQQTLPNPHPRFQGREGPHIRNRASDIPPLRLVKQVKRTLQVALGLFYASLSQAPAIGVLRLGSLLAQLLTSQQMLCGRFQVALLIV